MLRVCQRYCKQCWLLKPTKAETFTRKQFTFASVGITVKNTQVQSCGRICVRSIHKTATTNAPPVLLIALVRPLMKITSFIFGKAFRKWWKSLPNDKKALIKENLKRNWKSITGLFGLTCLGGYYFYETHIQITPITGRKRFMILPKDVMEHLAEAEYEENLKEWKDKLVGIRHPAYRRVQKVANSILSGNRDVKEIYDKDWSITIIDDPVKNAFVLPNGQIFVFTGILSICESDDDLAVVLGHEMSHAILGHAAEQIGHSHLVDALILVPLTAIWALIPSDLIAIITHWLFEKIVNIAINIPYVRHHEIEADTVGLTLIAKSCFDVRSSSAFWCKMSAIRDLEEDEELQVPDFVSTHPSNESRQQHLDELIPKALELRQVCKCPPLHPTDPRDSVGKFKKMVEARKKAELEQHSVRLSPSG